MIVRSYTRYLPKTWTLRITQYYTMCIAACVSKQKFFFFWKSQNNVQLSDFNNWVWHVKRITLYIMCHVHCTVNTATIITCDRCRGAVREVCNKRAPPTRRRGKEKNNNYNRYTHVPNYVAGNRRVFILNYIYYGFV